MIKRIVLLTMALILALSYLPSNINKVSAKTEDFGIEGETDGGSTNNKGRTKKKNGNSSSSKELEPYDSDTIDISIPYELPGGVIWEYDMKDGKKKPVPGNTLYIPATMKIPPKNNKMPWWEPRFDSKKIPHIHKEWRKRPKSDGKGTERYIYSWTSNTKMTLDELKDCRVKFIFHPGKKGTEGSTIETIYTLKEPDRYVQDPDTGGWTLKYLPTQTKTLTRKVPIAKEGDGSDGKTFNYHFTEGYYFKESEITPEYLTTYTIGYKGNGNKKGKTLDDVPTAILPLFSKIKKSNGAWNYKSEGDKANICKKVAKNERKISYQKKFGCYYNPLLKSENVGGSKYAIKGSYCIETAYSGDWEMGLSFFGTIKYSKLITFSAPANTAVGASTSWTSYNVADTLNANMKWLLEYDLASTQEYEIAEVVKNSYINSKEYIFNVKPNPDCEDTDGKGNGSSGTDIFVKTKPGCVDNFNPEPDTTKKTKNPRYTTVTDGINDNLREQGENPYDEEGVAVDSDSVGLTKATEGTSSGVKNKGVTDTVHGYKGSGWRHVADPVVY